MTLALATIPDDTDRLSGWLEAHIVGGDLRELAAELAAVHAADPPADSVRDRLGASLPAVLDRGLSALPRADLRHLLRQPYHLLELQEIVLVEGDAYWDTVSRPRELLDRVEAGRERLEAALFGPLAEPAPPVRDQQPRRPGGRRLLWAVAATAAAVFVATFAATRFFAPPPAAPGPTWGWAKANAFPKNLDRTAYLNRLADEADEWFDKRPDDPTTAARRIAEFREGCAALLLADHPPLAPADEAWLKERCRLWRGAFNDHRARLEDTGDVASALTATDATVRQLSKALRARAAAG